MYNQCEVHCDDDDDHVRVSQLYCRGVQKCTVVTVNILKIRKSKVRKLAAIFPQHALKIQITGRL